MFKYILKRIGYSILVLIGVSLIIYFLTRLMPIDFVKNKVVSVQTSGATVDTEMVDRMYEAYGLSENASFGDILTGIILFFIIGCEFFINYKLSLTKSSKKEEK